jgi:hypothetical protein
MNAQSGLGLKIFEDSLQIGIELPLCFDQLGANVFFHATIVAPACTNLTSPICSNITSWDEKRNRI